MSWRSFTPLAAASLLTLGGAWRVSEAGGPGWALLILGAVCLGAWLALFARDRE